MTSKDLGRALRKIVENLGKFFERLKEAFRRFLCLKVEVLVTYEGAASLPVLRSQMEWWKALRLKPTAHFSVQIRPVRS